MKTTLAFAALCLGAHAIHKIDVSDCDDDPMLLGCDSSTWGVDSVELTHIDDGVGTSDLVLVAAL